MATTRSHISGMDQFDGIDWDFSLTVKNCHASLLRDPHDPHAVDGIAGAICATCRAQAVSVPAERVRLLSGDIGLWSLSKTFYVNWSHHSQTVKARRFPDASGKYLVVFETASFATEADSLFAGFLMPVDVDTVPFQACSSGKSLCPAGNFRNQSARTCTMHTPQRKKHKLQDAGSSATCVVEHMHVTGDLQACSTCIC